jgi:hypothetical protein
MTSINGVERVVYVQPQERKGKNTALAQVGNAAVTTAGIVGAKKLHSAATHLSSRMLDDALHPLKAKGKVDTISPNMAESETSLIKIGKKIVGVFESLGEKLFKNGKIARQLEEKAKRIYGSKGSEAVAKVLKHYKGRAVMGIAAGATVLAFLVRGIFKAGEIKGEAK